MDDSDRVDGTVAMCNFPVTIELNVTHHSFVKNTQLNDPSLPNLDGPAMKTCTLTDHFFGMNTLLFLDAWGKNM